MRYRIRIKHNVPDKTFQLTLRYNDTSLNLDAITMDLTDSYQIFDLPGWENIPGTIDTSKVNIEGTSDEGDFIYVPGDMNISILKALGLNDITIVY